MGRFYGWIEQERLFITKSALSDIHDALKDFKHAWFSLYSASNDSFSWNHLQLIYRNKEIDKINYARNLLIICLNQSDDKQNRAMKSLAFFDFMQHAYDELTSIFPSGRIDLNDGNFLFDAENMKVIDFQSTDV